MRFSNILLKFSAVLVMPNCKWVLWVDFIRRGVERVTERKRKECAVCVALARKREEGGSEY